MRPKTGYAWLLLCLGPPGVGVGAQSAPQKPAPQQTVAVIVVNAHVDPAQPLHAVRVSLSYVDGSSRITDARDVTNRKGEAWLQVSPEAAQRGDVRIEIAGASDLVIYQPADGQLAGLPPNVSVKLLPKGSPALLGAAQIEAMLHRSLLQVSSLQKQNVALKSQKPDLTAALAEWAKVNGFATTDVDAKVQQWAEDIQRRSEQSTLQQRALSEIALKHYASAAQLFRQAADADGIALDQEQQRFLEGRRNGLRQLVQDKAQSANALQLNLQYHLATQTLEGARDRAAAEQKRYPEDQTLREISLDAAGKVANARWAEGKVSPASDSLRLLTQSVDDYRNLVSEYLTLGDRQSWAAAQVGLGKALVDAGERAASGDALALLNQAVEADHRALEVYTKANFPEDWAKTQVNLGAALQTEGFRSEGDKAVALFGQAVQAYQRALEVETKVDLPQYWAKTQMDLGNALVSQAGWAAGDKGIVFLDEGIQAYELALEVNTKADLPQEWALTQRNIGNALREEGERAAGDKAVALMGQSAEACQKALEVYTKSDLPQDWAKTQVNLGNALEKEGELVGGAKADALFDRAVQVYQRALEVFTKDYLPNYWAMTEYDLAGGHSAQGNYSAAVLDIEAVLGLYPNNTVIRMDYLEANLTAAHFDTCVQQAAIVDDVKLAGPLEPMRLIRDTMKLACQWGAGEKAAALESDKALLTKTATAQKGDRTFEGTLHFLAGSPVFEKGRASWVALFTSVQNGDAAGMSKALRELEPLMQN